MKLLNIKGTNMDLTDAIRNYVNEKIDSLDKYTVKYGESCTLEAEVGKTTEHHKQGPYYRCELNLQVPGKLLRAEATEVDLYAAIDAARDELRRQILDNKDRLNTLKRRGEASFKKFFSMTPWARRKPEQRPDIDDGSGS